MVGIGDVISNTGLYDLSDDPTLTKFGQRITEVILFADDVDDDAGMEDDETVFDDMEGGDIFGDDNDLDLFAFLDHFRGVKYLHLIFLASL